MSFTQLWACALPAAMRHSRVARNEHRIAVVRLVMRTSISELCLPSIGRKSSRSSLPWLWGDLSAKTYGSRAAGGRDEEAAVLGLAGVCARGRWPGAELDGRSHARSAIHDRAGAAARPHRGGGLPRRQLHRSTRLRRHPPPAAAPRARRSGGRLQLGDWRAHAGGRTAAPVGAPAGMAVDAVRGPRLSL